jgi:ribosomal protein S18 acetylase RimI-like enzyme
MKFQSSLNGITCEQLQGFFVGWPSHPNPETHLRMLQNSYKVVVALDEEADDRVVGFITAISDGVLSAYIPFLEVLPDYQNKGIGKKLVTYMLDELKEIYMIDLICDVNLQPYYEKFNMFKASGMIVRNYDRQTGSSIVNNI